MMDVLRRFIYITLSSGLLASSSVLTSVVIAFARGNKQRRFAVYLVELPILLGQVYLLCNWAVRAQQELYSPTLLSLMVGLFLLAVGPIIFERAWLAPSMRHLVAEDPRTACVNALFGRFVVAIVAISVSAAGLVYFILAQVDETTRRVFGSF